MFDRFFVLSAAAATLALAAGPAAAKMPVFAATCPTDIAVDADRYGEVRINGEKAKVHKSNGNYYEAKHAGITISIAIDGADLSVSYTLKGGANGICTVTARAGATDESGAMPGKDEQACLQAVSKETGNGDVVTLSVEESEANTLVMVGVGPDRAKWKCLAKNGVVAEVMSMTDEGAL